ncbi:hypothetical protein BGX30_006600 [Mortierella sp. GBA39]|nr:hypothetical protein BGX30_006600 [Mortierella sp. GBA39]
MKAGKVNKADKVAMAEEAEKVDKTSLLRAAMAKRIQDMVDDSTDDKMDGKVSIVYERLGDLQWLPGKGDGEFLRRIKHWRLIIQLGFDAFTLEFLENSIVSHQGVLIVGTYDQVESRNATAYPVGNLKGLSTEELYKWIQEQSGIWKEYNLLKNNCQHFVHAFLAHFENLGYLTRTDHLEAVRQKRQQEQSDQQSPPERQLPPVPQSEQTHFQQSQSEQPHLQQSESEQPYTQQSQSEQPHSQQSQSEQTHSQQSQSEQPHLQQSQSEQPHPQLNQTQQHNGQQNQGQQHQDQKVQDLKHLNHQYDNQAQQFQQYQDHQQQQEVQQVDQRCEQQWRSPKSDKRVRARSSSSPSKARVAKAMLGKFLGELGVKSKSFTMFTPKREDI